MKTISIALVLAMSVSGFGQEKKVDLYVNSSPESNKVDLYVNSGQPDYFGVIPHHNPDHHVRNRILLVTGAVVGAVAIGHMARSGSGQTNHGSSGNFPSQPLIPIVAVHK